MESSIRILEEYAEKFNTTYGPLYDSYEIVNLEDGVGNISGIKSFVAMQAVNE